MKPTVSKPIVGYRVWRLDHHNELLLSAATKIPWQRGVNLAAGCEEHPSPAVDCHCGFNAFYTLEDSDNGGYFGITGAIAGAGSVQLHYAGFRSSEAQIIALLWADDDYFDARLAPKEIEELRELSIRIADRYGVPLFENEEDFVEYVERFGSPTSEELRKMSGLEGQLAYGITKSAKPKRNRAPIKTRRRDRVAAGILATVATLITIGLVLNSYSGFMLDSSGNVNVLIVIYCSIPFFIMMSSAALFKKSLVDKNRFSEHQSQTYISFAITLGICGAFLIIAISGTKGQQLQEKNNQENRAKVSKVLEDLKEATKSTEAGSVKVQGR